MSTPNNPATQVASGTLTGFAIAGSDKNFVAATALIAAATNTVVVSDSDPRLAKAFYHLAIGP